MRRAFEVRTTALPGGIRFAVWCAVRVISDRSMRLESYETVNVDKKADALYLRLDDSPIIESEEVSPGVVLDYNESNEVVGVEMLHLSKRSSEPGPLRAALRNGLIVPSDERPTTGPPKRQQVFQPTRLTSQTPTPRTKFGPRPGLVFPYQLGGYKRRYHIE